MRRVEETFKAAPERDIHERAAWLDQECGDHLELRAGVESLLAHYDVAHGFLQKPGIPAHVSHCLRTSATPCSTPIRKASSIAI